MLRSSTMTCSWLQSRRQTKSMQTAGRVAHRSMHRLPHLKSHLLRQSLQSQPCKVPRPGRPMRRLPRAVGSRLRGQHNLNLTVTAVPAARSDSTPRSRSACDAGVAVTLFVSHGGGDRFVLELDETAAIVEELQREHSSLVRAGNGVTCAWPTSDPTRMCFARSVSGGVFGRDAYYKHFLPCVVCRRGRLI